MVRSLIMPKIFSSARIESEKAIGKQIRPVTVCSIKIIGGRTQRKVRDAAFFINGDFGPVVRATNIFPGIFRPSLITELTRERDRVKNPQHFSGDYVVSTQVPRRRFIFFSRGGPHQNKIFEDTSRSSGLDSPDQLGIAANSNPQVNHAVIAE